MERLIEDYQKVQNVEDLLIFMQKIVARILNELRTSQQLRWTIMSVVFCMYFTLILWVGVYDMKTNQSISQMYFLGSSQNFTTGHDTFDGMINGFGIMVVLGIVSFAMLAFALFDCQKIVKTWLTISCLMILYGVSGTIFYDICSKFLDVEEPGDQKIALFTSILFSLIYGSVGIHAFFRKSSILLHQFYVISNCSMIATFYLRIFPGTTAWFVLWSVAFWDIFAVLAPIGPLRKVQEKASDYSNNILRLLMFTADESEEIGRTCAGGDIEEKEMEDLKVGVKQLVELYSKREKFDNDFVEKIRQRRKAVNPNSELSGNSPMVESENSPILEESFKEQDFENESSSVETAVETSESSDSGAESSGSSSRESESFASTESDLIDENDVSTCDEIENIRENEAVAYNNHKTAADALNDGDTVRLGFGDFVFYSLMIGQSATSGSIFVIFFTGFGIIAGLISTLTILSSAEHTTPALPLSILIGTVMFYYGHFVEYIFGSADAFFEF